MHLAELHAFVKLQNTFSDPCIMTGASLSHLVLPQQRNRFQRGHILDWHSWPGTIDCCGLINYCFCYFKICCKPEYPQLSLGGWKFLNDFLLVVCSWGSMEVSITTKPWRLWKLFTTDLLKLGWRLLMLHCVESLSGG